MLPRCGSYRDTTSMGFVPQYYLSDVCRAAHFYLVRMLPSSFLCYKVVLRRSIGSKRWVFSCRNTRLLCKFMSLLYTRCIHIKTTTRWAFRQTIHQNECRSNYLVGLPTSYRRRAGSVKQEGHLTVSETRIGWA